MNNLYKHFGDIWCFNRYLSFQLDLDPDCELDNSELQHDYLLSNFEHLY